MDYGFCRIEHSMETKNNNSNCDVGTNKEKHDKASAWGRY